MSQQGVVDLQSSYPSTVLFPSRRFSHWKFALVTCRGSSSRHLGKQVRHPRHLQGKFLWSLDRSRHLQGKFLWSWASASLAGEVSLITWSLSSLAGEVPLVPYQIGTIWNVLGSRTIWWLLIVCACRQPMAKNNSSGRVTWLLSTNVLGETEGAIEQGLNFSSGFVVHIPIISTSITTMDSWQQPMAKNNSMSKTMVGTLYWTLRNTQKTFFFSLIVKTNLIKI